MTEIECKTVKIGGSIGIILPKEIVRKEDIKANQSIKLEIKTHPKAREFFGILPGTIIIRSADNDRRQLIRSNIRLNQHFSSGF